MRLFVALLSISLTVFTGPAVADGSRSGDRVPAIDAESDGVPGSIASDSGAIEGHGTLDRKRGWPPSPLESFLAQRSSGESDPIPGNRVELDSEIARLQRERSEINTRSPRVAKIVGGAMLAAGAVVGATAGITCAAADAGSGTRCNTTNATVLGVSGGVVALAGLITLIAGTTTLNRRRSERAEIERKIQKLERERSAVPENFEARVEIGGSTMISFAWRF